MAVEWQFRYNETQLSIDNVKLMSMCSSSALRIWNELVAVLLGWPLDLVCPIWARKKCLAGMSQMPNRKCKVVIISVVHEMLNRKCRIVDAKWL